MMKGLLLLFLFSLLFLITPSLSQPSHYRVKKLKIVTPYVRPSLIKGLNPLEVRQLYMVRSLPRFSRRMDACLRRSFQVALGLTAEFDAKAMAGRNGATDELLGVDNHLTSSTSLSSSSSSAADHSSHTAMLATKQRGVVLTFGVSGGASGEAKLARFKARRARRRARRLRRRARRLRLRGPGGKRRYGRTIALRIRYRMQLRLRKRIARLRKRIYKLKDRRDHEKRVSARRLAARRTSYKAHARLARYFARRLKRLQRKLKKLMDKLRRFTKPGAGRARRAKRLQAKKDCIKQAMHQIRRFFPGTRYRQCLMRNPATSFLAIGGEEVSSEDEEAADHPAALQTSSAAAAAADHDPEAILESDVPGEDMLLEEEGEEGDSDSDSDDDDDDEQDDRFHLRFGVTISGRNKDRSARRAQRRAVRRRMRIARRRRGKKLRLLLARGARAAARAFAARQRVLIRAGKLPGLKARIAAAKADAKHIQFCVSQGYSWDLAPKARPAQTEGDKIAAMLNAEHEAGRRFVQHVHSLAKRKFAKMARFFMLHYMRANPHTGSARRDRVSYFTRQWDKAHPAMGPGGTPGESGRDPEPGNTRSTPPGSINGGIDVIVLDGKNAHIRADSDPSLSTTH
jgi:hypothetical protein